MRGATAQYQCKCCRMTFTARVADRNRGWAKFCSKSCKAIKQTQRTGRGAPVFVTSSHPMSDRDLYDQSIHPFSDEAFEP